MSRRSAVDEVTETKRVVTLFGKEYPIVSEKDLMDKRYTLYVFYGTHPTNGKYFVKLGKAVKQTVYERYNSTARDELYKMIKVWESSIEDEPIHKVLKDESKDYPWKWVGKKDQKILKTKEAYYVESSEAIDAFIEFVTNMVKAAGILADTHRDRHPIPAYTPRGYQRSIIEKAVDLLSTSNQHKALLHLSTRCGKSYISLKICKDLGKKNILILTPFPAAEDSFMKLGTFNEEFRGYKYIRLTRETEERDFCDKNIIFCTYQYFDENKKNIKHLLRKIKPDITILDECHHTSDSERTTNFILKKLKSDKFIYMSGTPFNDIYSGYFTKEETITFDFLDFISYAIKHSDEISLPRLNVMNVCNLAKLQEKLMEYDSNLWKDADVFDYRVIFSNELHAHSFFMWLFRSPEGNKSLIVNKKHWFDLTNQKYIIAYFDRIEEAKNAESALKKCSSVNDYIIQRISGNDVDADWNEKEVNGLFNNKEGKKVIILSCGKLTTGVTLPKLDTIWNFKSSHSAEQFIQILFRTMTPYEGKNEVSMYCFDTEASLRVIKEYVTIRLDEASSNVARDGEKATFNGETERVLSCINFYSLDENMQFKKDTVDDYFPKIRNLPYGHRVSSVFTDMHAFDNVADLGTPTLETHDLTIVDAQGMAIRGKCEENNKARKAILAANKSSDEKKPNGSCSEKVTKQVYKILLNLDKIIFVYNNIKRPDDLTEDGMINNIWPQSLNEYKSNFKQLVTANYNRIEQMIEDIRWKEKHNLSDLIRGMSFSNSTDMKTPDELTKKLIDKLMNTEGVFCDPCCGVGSMFEYLHNVCKVPKNLCYGIEKEHLNVEICKKLGYTNVIEGDASDPKAWNELLAILKRNTRKMKFDHIIMNPPYNRNLHLKILNEAVKHSNDVVNLSPVRWLQDPLAERKRNSDYNKFKDIRNRIADIEIIDTNTANTLFNIMLLQPLGIYHLTNKGGYSTEHTEWYQKIFNKIIDENNFSKLNVQNYNDKLTNYVCLNIMAPPMKYGRPMYDWIKKTGVCTTENSYRKWKDSNSAATRGNVENTQCVVFSSYEEALNCYNTMNTKLARFCCSKSVVDVNVHSEYAPWLSDYTHPWTDDDLYKYFNLTPEEIAEIEKEFK